MAGDNARFTKSTVFATPAIGSDLCRRSQARTTAEAETYRSSLCAQKPSPYMMPLKKIWLDSALPPCTWQGFPKSLGHGIGSLQSGRLLYNPVPAANMEWDEH